MLGNVTPAIAVDHMEFDNQLVFLHGPLTLCDIRVQMVVPSLTTLLSNATGERFGNMSPIFGAVALNDSGQDLVFLLGPCAFGKMTTVVQFKPAGVALDLRLASDKLADAIPGVLAIHVNIGEEFHVLKKQGENI